MLPKDFPVPSDSTTGNESRLLPQDTQIIPAIETDPPAEPSIVTQEKPILQGKFRTTKKAKKGQKETKEPATPSWVKPAVPVDQDLFNKCRAFIDKVESRLAQIFTDPKLEPKIALTIPPEPSFIVRKDYFVRLEQYWLRLRDDGTTDDAISLPSDTPTPTIVAKISLVTPSRTTHHILQFDDDPVEEYQESFDKLSLGLHEKLKAEGESDSNSGAPSSFLIIPLEDLPKAGDIPDDKTDILYQRLIRGLLFTFQHPRGIVGKDNKFDPDLSLQRFAEAIAADRRDTGEQEPLFKTLCIVWSDKMDVIPVFFGHSAWRSSRPEGGAQRRTPGQEKVQQGFRQAVMSRTQLTPEEMVRQKGIHHPVEQCAENLALPFAFRAATRHLAETGLDVRTTIFSLVHDFECSGIGRPVPFCGNCVARVLKLVNLKEAIGIRIVDRGAQKLYEADPTVGCPTIFESKETRELFG